MAATLLAFQSGCASTRTDPAYNPYAPAFGDKPLLRSADGGMEFLEHCLDNIDRRLENAAY